MPQRRQQASPLATPRRAGPRPLPLHLMAHASTLMGSRVALPLLRNGLLPWKPSLVEQAESLRRELDAAGPEAWTLIEAEIEAESLRRHLDMMAGIEAYRSHPYVRDELPAPEMWRDGTTRLKDYRQGAGGLPVLVVPSLINRAYILDLTPRRSLLRGLARKGLAPFLVDWDQPGPEEQGFTLTDYVTRRLEKALDTVMEATGRKPAVVGYCMGGDLALALASRRPADVASLALLATPWDFHAGRDAHAILMRALTDPLGRLIDTMGKAPVDLLSAMFSSLDPNMTARKFAAFARLKRKSARARDFVALEDWANDGVPLAAPVAEECLFRWYGENDPARGRWRIDGEAVLPSQVRAPTLLMVPARDRIVPPKSALALADSIAKSKVMTMRGGHVGMLLASRAITEVYNPLAKWLVHSSAQ